MSDGNSRIKANCFLIFRPQPTAPPVRTTSSQSQNVSSNNSHPPVQPVVSNPPSQTESEPESELLPPRHTRKAAILAPLFILFTFCLPISMTFGDLSVVHYFLGLCLIFVVGLLFRIRHGLAVCCSVHRMSGDVERSLTHTPTTSEQEPTRATSAMTNERIAAAAADILVLDSAVPRSIVVDIAAAPPPTMSLSPLHNYRRMPRHYHHHRRRYPHLVRHHDPPPYHVALFLPGPETPSDDGPQETVSAPATPPPSYDNATALDESTAVEER